MTVCPIAIVAGCRKCPVFGVCPLKSVLGDQVKGGEAPKQRGAPERARRPVRKKGV